LFKVQNFILPTLPKLVELYYEIAGRLSSFNPGKTDRNAMHVRKNMNWTTAEPGSRQQFCYKTTRPIALAALPWFSMTSQGNT